MKTCEETIAIKLKALAAPDAVDPDAAAELGVEAAEEGVHRPAASGLLFEVRDENPDASEDALYAFWSSYNATRMEA